MQTTNLLLGKEETSQYNDFIILLQRTPDLNGYCYQFQYDLDRQLEVFSIDLRILGELNYAKYHYDMNRDTFNRAMQFFYGFLFEAIENSQNESWNILDRMTERSLKNNEIKNNLKTFKFYKNAADTKHTDLVKMLENLRDSKKTHLQNGGKYDAPWMRKEISTLHDILCLALFEKIIKYEKFSSMIVTVVGNPIKIDIKGVSDFQLTTQMLDDSLNAVRESAILQSNHWDFLGEGSFGKCVRHKEKTNLVLKSMKYSADYSESWKREASYAQDLEHDNVVKVLTKPIIYNNRIFFLTEYAGQCLGDIYRGRQAMEIADIRKALLDVSRAACYIHSERLIHRDIHDNNVTMNITDNGRKVFKLIDFGMSTLVPKGDSRMGSATVTNFDPFNASPERVRSVQVLYATIDQVLHFPKLPIPGYKSDVWMIGIFGLHLLCFSVQKRLPEHRKINDHRLYADNLIKGRIKFQELTDETLDEGIRGILKNCLNYDEKERWNSLKLCLEVEKLVKKQTE